MTENGVHKILMLSNTNKET